MGWSEVAHGGLLDAINWQQYDQQVDEGQMCKLDVALNYTLGASDVSAIQRELDSQGVDDAYVSSRPYIAGGASMLSISFRKTSFWLSVVVIAIIFLALAVVGWWFYKLIEENPPVVPTWLIPLFLGGLGLYLIFMLPNRQVQNNPRRRLT